jgi:hypothetical protein
MKKWVIIFLSYLTIIKKEEENYTIGKMLSEKDLTLENSKLY